MTGPVRVVLAFLPLAIYFFVLGYWQSRPKPRVVSGALDFGMLAFGLGGLVAFGPVGQFLVGAVFPQPSLAAWVAVASFVGLLAMLGVIPARTRMVVYHVEEHDLEHALFAAFERIEGSVTPTLHGFENVKSRRGVTVEIGRRLRSAVIQAHGDQPGHLIESLRHALVEKLDGVQARLSRMAGIWFGLCLGTLLSIPILAYLVSHPEIQATLPKG